MAHILYSIEIHNIRSLTLCNALRVCGYIFYDVSIIIIYSIRSTINQFGLEFTSVPKYHALLCLYIFELIHDQLPLAVPCYDLVPVTKFTLGHINADFGHPRLP